MTVNQIIFSIFVLLLALLLSIYSGSLINFFNNLLHKQYSDETLFTSDDLQKYNGVRRPQLYLAILGNVYDVSKGRKHYGPEGTYNIFVGRDASRAFVSGEFSASGASDDVTGLTKNDLMSLNNWVQFYTSYYKKVGKLVGRYYDENGMATQYGEETKNLIDEAKKEKENETIDHYRFPPCNIEWHIDKSTRVWCTKKSGGIERSWVGYPRKMYEPGSESFRCACIKKEDLSLGNLQEYKDCDPKLVSCYVKD